MLNLTASDSDQPNTDLTPQITVVGVGGAGCNAVNNMIASKLEGVRFITCNTDAQALNHSLAPSRIQLGTRVTSGLGAGSKPDVGKAAAEESIEAVLSEIEGANMVFITAGMGGGTGTGAAPIIARAAKEAGILTVGVVTKPFHFEGAQRMRLAEAGLSEMQEYVDTLIVIPNQNLFRIANEKTTFADAFKLADSVLQSGVRGVTDLMVMPGLINLDFADVRCAMMEMGKAMMGTGEAEGERRAVEAAERAINNPLLDDISMKGAKGVIINISGGYDMTLFEVDEACNRIRDEVDADANIIFGSTFDESLEGVMRVTVLATGIEAEGARRGRPVRAANHQTSALQSSMNQPASSTSPSGPNGGGIEGMYGSASGVQSQLVVPSVQSRVSAPAAAQANAYGQDGNTARKMEMGGGVGYQQQELSVGHAQPAGEDQSRAMRYGGAFIPPRPVNPEGGRARFAASELDMQQMPAAPKAPVSQEMPQSAPVAPRPSGLQLNPPVPGAKKRAPSLFDKIATMFSEGDEDDGDIGGGAASDGSSSQGGGLFSSFVPRRNNNTMERPVEPQMRAEPQFHQQPASAAMQPQQAAPAMQPQTQQADSQPDLEIPAFLRRQVS